MITLAIKLSRAITREMMPGLRNDCARNARIARHNGTWSNDAIKREIRYRLMDATYDIRENMDAESDTDAGGSPDLDRLLDERIDAYLPRFETDPDMDMVRDY